MLANCKRERECEVCLNAAGTEGRPLWEKHDPRAPDLRGDRTRGFATEPELAGKPGKQPGERTEQRGLARTGCTAELYDVAGSEVERHVVQDTQHPPVDRALEGETACSENRSG